MDKKQQLTIVIEQSVKNPKNFKSIFPIDFVYRT